MKSSWNNDSQNYRNNQKDKQYFNYSFSNQYPQQIQSNSQNPSKGHYNYYQNEKNYSQNINNNTVNDQINRNSNIVQTVNNVNGIVHNNINNNNNSKINNSRTNKVFQSDQQTANRNNKNEEKQNNRPIEYNYFIQTLIKYQDQLPKQTFKPYKLKIRKYQTIWSYAKLAWFGYLSYVMFGLQKRWFNLTTNRLITGIRLFAFISIPSFLMNKRITDTNYQYYKMNEVQLKQILTKEDKLQMKLSELLQKYQ